MVYGQESQNNTDPHSNNSDYEGCFGKCTCSKDSCYQPLQSGVAHQQQEKQHPRSITIEITIFKKINKNIISKWHILSSVYLTPWLTGRVKTNQPVAEAKDATWWWDVPWYSMGVRAASMWTIRLMFMMTMMLFTFWMNNCYFCGNNCYFPWNNVVVIPSFFPLSLASMPQKNNIITWY